MIILKINLNAIKGQEISEVNFLASILSQGLSISPLAPKMREIKKIKAQYYTN
jgi:hypothetical protein